VARAATTPMTSVRSPSALRGHDPANPGAHTDRGIHSIQVRNSAEQFERVARHAGNQRAVEGAHQVQFLSLRQFGRMLGGFLKISAVFDQFRSQRAHRGVLLATVAERNHDDRAQSHAARRERHTLAVISTSRCNHPGDVGFATVERIHVDNAAAYLERPDGRVILMLHPGLRSDAGTEQRPPDLRRRRHDTMDKFRRGLERSEGR